VVADTNPNWFFDIFSWEHLMAVTTVFALLTTTAIVPVWQLLKKRKAEKEKHLEERETQKIKTISEEVIKSVVERLNKHNEIIQGLQQAAKENDRDTRDTLQTLKVLSQEFQKYTNQQNKLNAKLYFLEGSYRGENARGYRDWRTIKIEDDENGNGYHYDDNNGTSIDKS
jgi:TolA-binding protein